MTLPRMLIVLVGIFQSDHRSYNSKLPPPEDSKIDTSIRSDFLGKPENPTNSAFRGGGARRSGVREDDGRRYHLPKSCLSE